MDPKATRWYELLRGFGSLYTSPGLDRFIDLLTAWVLYPGRHTITHLWQVMDPLRRRRYEAYAAFLREGRWPRPALFWRRWTQLLVAGVARLSESIGEELSLLLDDTLLHKTGRKVAGAGQYHDAVRSTKARTVTAWGLNVVVLALHVTPPWGGEPWAVPINVRIHHKGEATLLDLAEAMIREVSEWLPQYRFALSADGAYAALARRHLPRTAVYSRMRRDAALYAAPPARKKGQRGRPRKRGERLPTPTQWADTLPQSSWKSATVAVRGKTQQRFVVSQTVLWYKTCPDALVLMVLVRDPAGREPDDFFFTTDSTATAVAVLEHYGGRWTIEETFRATKQQLHAETPQSWTAWGPERVVVSGFLTYGLVWFWYLLTQGAEPTMLQRPWYRTKRTPSFVDALAELRTHLWGVRIYSEAQRDPGPPKIDAEILRILAEAG